MKRRQFLKRGLQWGGMAAIPSLLGSLAGCDLKQLPAVKDYPELVGNQQLMLARHLFAKPISVQGEMMDDGWPVPQRHDGTACFMNPKGNYVLIRNHEIAYGPEVPESTRAFDPIGGGGTTTIEVTPDLQVRRHHWSLRGTFRNCGGGVTPWGTWISCEEIFLETEYQRHGYAFEVDPLPNQVSAPRPLKSMGRFNREGVAIDPVYGAVYQTEDIGASCLLRFLPTDLKDLSRPGRLQALVIEGHLGFRADHFRDLPDQPAPVRWVDIDEIDPEENTIHVEAQSQGAAIFTRGEGTWHGPEGIYFTVTSGGLKHWGQIFHYRPLSPDDGLLELVYECEDKQFMNPDNMTIAPWGDLIVCEDRGLTSNQLVGITPDKRRYVLAVNTIGEWTGVCFSPDGRTMFANIQDIGYTLAISAPWQRVHQTLELS